MRKIVPIERRTFIKNIASLGALTLLPPLSFDSFAKEKGMKMGLVTYLWGKDWDCPTIIKNCSAASIYGVELRVEHAHGVEPEISASRRSEVKKMFADSQVKIVGLGTNQQYDFVEPEKVKASIKRTEEFIKLSKDIGGTGVKVKPNAFHEGEPHEKTLEQIGRALNECGKIAADHGQKIRLEVHGTGTQELPNIKTIMDVADNKAVVVCWNCNDEDLLGDGLEPNFNLVKNRIGDTVHIREMNIGSYPYQDLMNLFVKMKYNGWILLECRTDPSDKVKAMIEQRELMEKMIAKK
jgi:sugar phosphate isomerase/epimerase